MLYTLPGLASLFNNAIVSRRDSPTLTVVLEYYDVVSRRDSTRLTVVGGYSGDFGEEWGMLWDGVGQNCRGLWGDFEIALWRLTEAGGWLWEDSWGCRRFSSRFN